MTKNRRPGRTIYTYTLHTRTASIVEKIGWVKWGSSMKESVIWDETLIRFFFLWIRRVAQSPLFFSQSQFSQHKKIKNVAISTEFLHLNSAVELGLGLEHTNNDGTYKSYSEIKAARIPRFEPQPSSDWTGHNMGSVFPVSSPSRFQSKCPRNQYDTEHRICWGHNSTNFRFIPKKFNLGQHC